MPWPAPDAYRNWLDDTVADWRAWAQRYRDPTTASNLIEVPDPVVSAYHLERLADQLEQIANNSSVGVLVTVEWDRDEGRWIDPRAPQPRRRRKKKGAD